MRVWFAAIVIGLSMSGTVAARDSKFLTCNDILQRPQSAALVIGWLNLQNLDGVGQNFDFEKADADRAALERTCTLSPNLPLYRAVTSTFEEVDLDGIQAPTDNTNVASTARAR